MHDIKANIDGSRQTVLVPHAPENPEKITRIAENLVGSGWVGRPVIAYRAGDCVIAITGSHRVAAAAAWGGEIEAAWLPDDLTAEEWDLIECANDDDDRLAALVEINDGRNGEIDEIVGVMRAEITEQ